MKVWERVARRSGVLKFDADVDGDTGLDDVDGHLRLRWLSTLHHQVDSVVDFGCWTGATLASVSACRRVGLDLAGPWLDGAKQRLPDAEVLAVESFETVPDGLAGTCDLALFLETIEHIPRGTEVTVLETIYASLRVGGTLIVTTPAAGLASVLDPAWLLTGHRHYRTKTLRRLLSAAGFRQIEVRYSGNVFTAADILAMYIKKHLLHRRHSPGPRLLRWLDTGLYERARLDSATVWALCKK